MSWSIQPTNSLFVPQGEIINIEDMKVTIGLSKARTAGFKVRLDNPLAPYLAQAVSTEPIYIKAYRNGALMFNGPVMTVQEAGEEAENASLSVNAIGPEFIWGLRYYTSSAIPLKLAAGTSRGAKFKAILDAYAESVTPQNRTFIDHTTGPIMGGGTGEFEIQAFKTVSELLSELTNTTEGFDWIVTPTEPAVVSGVTTIAKLEAQEVIGSQKPNAVFEWGGSRNNIASFNRTVDVTNVANIIYSVSPAGSEAPGSPVQTASDAAAGEQWTYRQAQAPLSALNNAMRLKLAEETLAVRKKPRQTFTFTPTVDNNDGRVPRYGSGADYSVGDTVRARVIYEESVHLDILARVWGISFSVDSNGKETETLTLSEE